MHKRMLRPCAKWAFLAMVVVAVGLLGAGGQFSTTPSPVDSDQQSEEQGDDEYRDAPDHRPRARAVLRVLVCVRAARRAVRRTHGAADNLEVPRRHEEHPSRQREVGEHRSLKQYQDAPEKKSQAQAAPDNAPGDLQEVVHARRFRDPLRQGPAPPPACTG